MSPVFRHGRLRLYLLKLLDDAPKHGYEVIRLLQDRFMGVYAPSPGTIYPRLARLEEEGLVTHDEVDGRKVYRLTDKGRAEIRERVDDLAELEEEITESVRDIAREVKEDVRETVRSLREEIARAARDVRRDDPRRDDSRRDDAREPGGDAGRARDRAQWERERAQWERERARRERDDYRRERDQARRERDYRREETQPDRDYRREEPARDRGEGGSPWQEAVNWERESGGGRGPHEDYERAQREHQAGEEAQAGARFGAGRGRSRRDWGDWSGLRDWPGWRDWPGLKDWRDWPGSHDWPGPGRAPGWPDPAKFRDLERLALQFASDLRRLATHASAIGEDALVDLREILDEALGRIRTEIFVPERRQDEGGTQGEGGTEPEAGADDAPTTAAADAQADAREQARADAEPDADAGGETRDT
jgi:DNA-binding PadR family transcriptional regulator